MRAIAKLKKEYGSGVCETCENDVGIDNLDASHIAPQSGYPELATVKENIQWQCRSCHMDWEARKFDLTNDRTVRSLLYLRDAAPERYHEWDRKHGPFEL